MAKKEYTGKTGLQYIFGLIKAKLDTKADKDYVDGSYTIGGYSFDETLMKYRQTSAAMTTSTKEKVADNNTNIKTAFNAINDNCVWISQAEFDELTQDQKDAHKSYYIYDAKSITPSGTVVGVRYFANQADYDALSASEKANIKELVITGGSNGPLTAREVQYDANNTVDGAISELNNAITNISDDIIELPSSYTFTPLSSTNIVSDITFTATEDCIFRLMWQNGTGGTACFLETRTYIDNFMVDIDSRYSSTDYYTNSCKLFKLKKGQTLEVLRYRNRTQIPSGQGYIFFTKDFTGKIVKNQS